MRKEDKKLIKHYTRLRGEDQPQLKEEILREVYRTAKPHMQALYKQEMREYIEAVVAGKLKPGQQDTLLRRTL